MIVICPITNIPLRNSVQYPELFISRCGRIYHKANSHKFVMLSRTEKYRYLQVSAGTNVHLYVHILVGHAWVYNPCPGVFKVIDHIDRVCQNNDGGSNIRWITQQLNCLNQKLKKGWEKIVKKNGAVFYKSEIRIDGKRHTTYCRSKEEAIETSKAKQREFFDSIYKKHIDDFESSGIVNERLDHTFLWTDKPVETPEGLTPGDTQFRRCTEGRRAKFVF